MINRDSKEKNTVSRDDALQLAADYVAFVEGDFTKFETVENKFSTLRKGSDVLTYDDGVFFLAKVTKLDHNSYQAVDGPVVRVSNGEYSWRVDGSYYAWPLASQPIS